MRRRRSAGIIAGLAAITVLSGGPANAGTAEDPELIARGIDSLVSDGSRYAVFRRAGRLEVYDSRRERARPIDSDCIPLDGDAGRFLLACDPDRPLHGNAVLVARTRAITPVALQNPNDDLTRIGRQWMSGSTLEQGQDTLDLYVSLRRAERRTVRRGTTGIPGYAHPRDIDSASLPPAPPLDGGYALFERDGRFALALPRSSSRLALITDARSRTTRRITCANGCLDTSFGSGRFVWVEFPARGSAKKQVRAYDAATGAGARWAVLTRVPAAANEVVAQHTSNMVLIAAITRARFEDHHGPQPTAYSLFAARWP